jgi:hypothetical protein
LLQISLSLAGAHHQLAETIHGSVQAQKDVHDSGKGVHARAGEKLFIEFQFDPRAARETDAIGGCQAGEMRLAANIEDAVDLFFRGLRFGEIMQAQDFPKCFGSFGYQGKVVEGELRNQPPKKAGI